ncbi:MAG: DnaJ domain-containing protein [Crocinitomicaceae bacterium]
MSGKTYYEILNLPEGASKAEIKKSYRALVKLYHPDVTDDPKAHEKYLEINQAYEALTEPQKTKNKPNSHNTSTRENKWNKYREQSKKKYAERQLKKEIEIQQFYKSLRLGWRRNWIRINALIGLIISLFMIADQFAEPVQRKIKVTGFKNYSTNNSITTIEGDFTVDETHSSIRGKSEFVLFESKYLKHGLFINYDHEGEIQSQKILYSPITPSFYWGYKIVLFVSLMPFVFYVLFRKNNAWFVFLHFSCLIVTTPWLVYFVAKHPIMFHVLQFGLD